MPLFETLPVDKERVRELVARHWGAELGDLLKASQNHTFAATRSSDGARIAVRVTPDAAGAHTTRIQDEVFFVDWLARGDGGCVPGVCAPVRTLDDALVVRDGDLTVVASSWAPGALVDFAAFTWMTDATLIRAWGAWMARQHAAARRFADRFPEAAARMQRWDDIHDKILRDAPLDPEDAATAAGGVGPGFLLTHGDLNISNFHVVRDAAGEPSLAVFDFDQVHLAWPEFDIAQSALAARMLEEAGAIVVRTRVPQADHRFFLDAFVAGYESVAGAGAVDRARLQRMSDLRKSFYGRFATRAFAEGDVPPGMAAFLAYVDGWANKGLGPVAGLDAGGEGGSGAEERDGGRRASVDREEQAGGGGGGGGGGDEKCD